ncbi:FliH/SctL family protein [Thermaerobacter subterraneus]|uniref:Flagellar biosynthesis/type III secretory pathway protein n=1 Tax=Thermaerobacter subterraneus DSM 13965 TaxID=867903 RepID=K6PYS0_9FIRM|nr:FliH/SctL family protein [Thermaerobacter subterraneus]EKP93679.1 flagellar biosynthesis/type III secretory pathway protein [Thermaerobacter subterraneus DSM 13965]
MKWSSRVGDARRPVPARWPVLGSLPGAGAAAPGLRPVNWQSVGPAGGTVAPAPAGEAAAPTEAGPAAGPLPAAAQAAAGRRVRRWLRRARRAAAAHLEKARREADALCRQAREEGFRRGEQEGRARWEAACRQLEEQAARQREELAAAYRRLVEASAGPVLELVLVLARRVAGEALAVDAAALRRQIEAALARLGSEGARVLVHPESLARLEEASPLPAGVELVADLTLAPGDYRVETPRGLIDGRVEAQMQRLGRALREAGPGGGADSEPDVIADEEAARVRAGAAPEGREGA